eukprot:jgi/Mesvir1/27353/Mv07166-RA.1
MVRACLSGKTAGPRMLRFTMRRATLLSLLTLITIVPFAESGLLTLECPQPLVFKGMEAMAAFALVTKCDIETFGSPPRVRAGVAGCPDPVISWLIDGLVLNVEAATLVSLNISVTKPMPGVLVAGGVSNTISATAVTDIAGTLGCTSRINIGCPASSWCLECGNIPLAGASSPLSCIPAGRPPAAEPSATDVAVDGGLGACSDVPPIISCLGNQAVGDADDILGTDPASPTFVSFSTVATDVENPTPSVTCSADKGAAVEARGARDFVVTIAGGPETTKVTCVASDGSQQSEPCTTAITVVDDESCDKARCKRPPRSGWLQFSAQGDSTVAAEALEGHHGRCLLVSLVADVLGLERAVATCHVSVTASRPSSQQRKTLKGYTIYNVTMFAEEDEDVAMLMSALEGGVEDGSLLKAMLETRLFGITGTPFMRLLSEMMVGLSLVESIRSVSSCGARLDFSGVPGSVYCAISDPKLHINVLLDGAMSVEGGIQPAAREDQKLYIGAIGFRYRSTHIDVSIDPTGQWSASYHGVISVGGRVAPVSSLLTLTDDVTIKRRLSSITLTFGTDATVVVDIVRAASKEEHKEPGRNYFELKSIQMMARPPVSGLVGQNLFSDCDGNHASPGVMAVSLDYQSTGLLMADCPVSAFRNTAGKEES